MSKPSTHGPRAPLLDDQTLFNQIVEIGQLQSAWQKVWRNQGAAGGDGVTVSMFSALAHKNLRYLSRALIDGSYRPKGVRHFEIKKKSGGHRPLAIPSVIDRVTMTSAAQILTPLFDEEFEPSSFGYRPGRSVNQAVMRVRDAQSEGFDWLVDADIEKYFERIPHDQLMERWGQSVSAGPLSELVWIWLTHAHPSGLGVSQGSPLSPLLANLYLDRLDEALHGRGMRLVRFADDFVILCREQRGAEAALRKVDGLLREFGLSLNQDKTRIRSFDHGFKFLGHLFIRSMVLKTSPVSADENSTDRLLAQIAETDKVAEKDRAADQERVENLERSGYSPGFRVLYVRTPDRRVNVRNEAFTVEEGSGLAVKEEGGGVRWRELIALPHQDVDRIDIGPNCHITDDAISHALSCETPVCYVNGHEETQGWTSSGLAPRAKRHLAQAAIFLNEEKRLLLARIFVHGRLQNQRAMLRRLIRGKKPSGQITETLTRLNLILGKLEQATSISQLMGYEGAATAGYWAALGKSITNSDFKFSKRSRGRGAEPFNIILNFLSHLLERDISAAIVRAGLHPGFGALHTVDDYRDACVYDLMEEFRAPLIGGLAVYFVNRNIVRWDMFTQLDSGGFHLNRAGGDAIIKGYERRLDVKIKSVRTNRLQSWRRLMLEQAFAFAVHIEGGETYKPYQMDY